ncbi:MAG TPA: efflux RND transporter periplasmic adaptor subunit [Thermoanaerobaculia bacterium]|nr:efflux RND transporter periplasmic adaptor subunit [Thermoanaerobaculia bacterium]
MQETSRSGESTRARDGFVLACTAFAVLPLACRDAERATAADPPRIEVKATVAAFDGVTVHSPIEGTIVELKTTEGATVQQGDVLATLTNPVVERDLAYARAAVLAAEQRLRSVGAPRAAPRSNAAREQAAAETVRQKQQRLERLRGLLASGDVARQDVENAEAELALARRELDAERDRGAVPAAAPAADRALLAAEVERARADQVFAEHRKAQLVIKTPASGTIARLRVAAGADIYTRDPIADIVDSKTARVQAQLAPELLRFVRAGRPVDVKLMTIPPRRFREPIARVIPPGGEGGSSIIVNIPNPDRMLQPGTPAVITIQ